MEQEKKAKRENVVAGIVGAFLGSLIGVICTVVIGQMGYVASVSGLVMAVGALKGYELLGGRLSKKGAVISSVMVIAMTYLAHRLSVAVALARAIGTDLSGLFACFESIPELVENGAIERKDYWGDLAMLYLFTLLGAVPTIIGGLRAASMPDYPPAAPTGQEGEPINATFYPGQHKWMSPLRISASLSMFAALIPACVLIFAGIADGSASTFILASLGCLLAAFIVMGIALSSIQLCNNAMLLLVRVSGTVWKVTLPMLNNADTYRFTKKTGAFRAIRWDILNQEEQERAKMSVMRAVTLLSSGQVMPGSMLGAAVLPLTGLQIVKVTKWSWKCVYSTGNGREKKISIPKAYPGFVPVSGMEPAQGPVPVRWSLLGIAVVLAALLSLIGAGIGYQFDNPVSSRNPTATAEPTVEPTAETTAAPTAESTVEPTAEATQTPTAPPETYDPKERFHVGTELGYEYTAVGYIRVPDEMFQLEDAYVDVHVPFSDAPEYLDDGYTIRSAAHGMEVTVTVAHPYENAQEVVDAAYAQLEDAGTDIYNAADTQYFEDYDVAAKQLAYFEDNQTKVRVAVLYADYKQEGYYLSVAIVYQPELMDEDYPALLEELSDAYALNLPEITPLDEEAV